MHLYWDASLSQPIIKIRVTAINLAFKSSEHYNATHCLQSIHVFPTLQLQKYVNTTKSEQQLPNSETQIFQEHMNAAYDNGFIIHDVKTNHI